MPVRIVQAHHALVPFMRLGRVHKFHIQETMQLYHKGVKIVHLEIQFHIVGLMQDGALGDIHQRVKILLNGKTAREGDVLPEVCRDLLIKQVMIKLFGNFHIPHRKQRQPILNHAMPPS